MVLVGYRTVINRSQELSRDDQAKEVFNMDKNDKMGLLSAVRAATEVNEISKAISINLWNVVRLKGEIVPRCEAMGLECGIDYETANVTIGEKVVVEDSAKLYLEAHDIGAAMKRHGGAFVQLLGEMLDHADYENSKKIKKAWPEYWRQYKEMAAEDYNGKEMKDEAK
jgi:hypothetical protein